jgi:adenylate cyclase
MNKSRQLAAIMFTDIEGYTSLMQENEEKAVQTRDKHRLIFNSQTEGHRGRILQYYGDGTLSVFNSAIDAVQCAIEMQLRFQEEPAIPVRIGIHIGDIIFSEEEIIGDGVNVASRIESLAVSGSVFISDKVFDEIKNQESIQTAYLKQFHLKNIDRPIDVYAISNPGLIVPNAEDIKGKTAPPKTTASEQTKEVTPKRLILLATSFIALVALFLFAISTDDKETAASYETQEASIAVLAFENMSNDPSQEYFSDGISEEILNALAKVDGLKVAGRTSAFSFKGSNEDIPSIGKKLDVNMILEGSVRKAGEKVRITAQLINVEDGFHIWSETYDRELEDIFAIQDEIANNIMEKLKVEVQKSLNSKVKPPTLEAYDLVLKGNYFLAKDFDGTEKAMEYFRQAIELDPTYAEPYALIGDAYINYAFYGIMPPTEALRKAESAAQKAINLNQREPLAHRVMAYVYLLYDWDWDEALKEYNQALSFGLRDPDHFMSIYEMFINNDFERGIAISEQILASDPLMVGNHWHVGISNFYARNYKKALASFDDALELDDNYSEGYRWKGLTLANLGQLDEAKSALEKALEITAGKGPANFDLLLVKTLNGELDEIHTILEQSELAESEIEPMVPATLYALLGNKDKALDWLLKCYEQKSFLIIGSMKVSPIWDPYKADPRFQKIYQQMNFPEQQKSAKNSTI